MTGAGACPRCATALQADQDWCLECGLAARTRVPAAPAWRRLLISAGVLSAAALVGLVLAFVLATHGDNAVPSGATTAPPPAATTAP